MPYIRYDIPLLPYIARRHDHEERRAARGRTERTRKVRKIPTRFVSVNRMYPINPHSKTKRLSDEGRIFKDYVHDCMELQDARDATRKIFSCEAYECTYVYYCTQEMLYTKNGDFKKEDVSNFLKATEDAVFEYLLEDDSTVVSIHGHKRFTVSEPMLVVLLSAADIDDPVVHGGLALDTHELLSEAEDNAESFSRSLRL